MQEVDYYQVLGVEKNTDARKIKEAYRDLAFKYHPDRNQGNPDGADKMKRLNEAYAVLSDTDKRREYDLARQQFGSSAYTHFRRNYSEQDIFSGSDINKIFEEMTRSFGFRPFEEVFREFYGQGYRSFEFQRPGFRARGFMFGGPRGRGRCRRRHFQQAQPSALPGVFGKVLQPLLQKIAAGRIPAAGAALSDTITLHPDLARRGGPYAYFHKKKSKRLVVQVPAGIREGQRIRLAGMGHNGRNGGLPGDLYLTVRIRASLGQKLKGLIGRFNP